MTRIQRNFPSALFHPAGLLILRMASGGLMALHGLGKMSDLFTGKHDFFDPFGWGGAFSLAMAAFAECFCSLLVIFGIKTRLALLPLITTMAVAFFLFHSGEELPDKELPLLYLLIFIALLVTGPGRYSFDEHKHT